VNHGDQVEVTGLGRTEVARIFAGIPQHRPGRYIGRCSKCRRGVAADVVSTHAVTGTRLCHAIGVRADGGIVRSNDAAARLSFVLTCACGAGVNAQRVIGRHRPDVPCTAKCTAATGPNCDCSCRGKNHGGAHV
jgi:hypothetical protein